MPKRFKGRYISKKLRWSTCTWFRGMQEKGVSTPDKVQFCQQSTPKVTVRSADSEMRLFHKTYATYFSTEFSSKTTNAMGLCMCSNAYERYQLQILV